MFSALRWLGAVPLLSAILLLLLRCCLAAILMSFGDCSILICWATSSRPMASYGTFGIRKYQKFQSTEFFTRSSCSRLRISR
jgi:hypothetical protein